MESFKGSVLVIDDEEAARYGTGKALEREGHSVLLAANGVEALEQIRHHSPHVIISDISMPQMDGITLLKEVANLPHPPPVVLITAHGSESVAIQALRAGAFDYLTKPFELEELRAVVRNALERRKLELENQRYLQELERTLQELKESQTERIQAEKMASLGRLVAGIAHETNSPLGALACALKTFEKAAERFTQLWHACGKSPDPEQQMQFEKLMGALSQSFLTATEAAERLDSTIKTMRRFANLDRSPIQPVDIRNCLENVLAMLRHAIPERIQIQKDYGDIPLIEGYPQELNQLFANLLLNSLEAIEGPGEIRIGVVWQEGRVWVEIRDNGKGIAPDNLPKVFDPGFTTKGRGVGIGMGLAICRKLLDLHGGTLEILSQPGSGTRVKMAIPSLGIVNSSRTYS